jgi:hypothetical protein
MTTPIFIFSLPRSGSTLLQRILQKHQQISTTSEPWLLIPIAYSLKQVGIFSEYNHSALNIACDDICTSLNGGREEYLKILADGYRRIYAKLANGATYFLDKTPRYSLILNEIQTMFPDAKSIILWRNPLAVSASIMSTWSNGKWILPRFYVDLYDGFENLYNYSQQNNFSYSLMFEDLINSPEDYIADICSYLRIPYSDDLVSGISASQVGGPLGDKTGVIKYNTISSEPNKKWLKMFSNPLRRKWAIEFVSNRRQMLDTIGYNTGDILCKLRKSASSKYLFSDVIHMPYENIRFSVREYVLRRLKN